jgi:hypothetical protein
MKPVKAVSRTPMTSLTLVLPMADSTRTTAVNYAEQRLPLLGRDEYLSAPINWTTNSISTLDGSGAFSNTIPINASQPANFFRMRISCVCGWTF